MGSSLRILMSRSPSGKADNWLLRRPWSIRMKASAASFASATRIYAIPTIHRSSATIACHQYARSAKRALEEFDFTLFIIRNMMLPCMKNRGNISRPISKNEGRQGKILRPASISSSRLYSGPDRKARFKHTRAIFTNLMHYS